MQMLIMLDKGDTLFFFPFFYPLPPSGAGRGSGGGARERGERRGRDKEGGEICFGGRGERGMGRGSADIN